jgi:hypothetical protein
MAKDCAHRPDDYQHNGLRYFAWEQANSLILTIVLRTSIAIALLLLAAAVILHQSDASSVTPDGFSISCCSPSISLEERLLIIAFLDAFAIIVGALFYSMRSFDLQTFFERRVEAEFYMKKRSDNRLHHIPRSRIKVAAPCAAEWKFMYGDDRVRFCGQCNLNIYNLSALTREEAEDLIRQTEGQSCQRYYRRKDGTVLTQNCSSGIKANKKRARRLLTASLALALSFLTNSAIMFWVVDRELESKLAELTAARRVISEPLSDIPLMNERDESTRSAIKMILEGIERESKYN